MAEENAELWRKRFERERDARKAAEQLLEEKSIEIWQSNQKLEKTVAERTQALSEALKQAKEANRAKDTFLSNTSHELRTPLNAIIGFSQIILARQDTPEKVRNLIEKVYLSGNNLLTLVNMILDLSKIEAGKMEVNKAPFVLHDLLQEVSVLIEPMIQKKELKLEIDFENNELLIADRQLIKQAILNLVTNAIKFSPNKSLIKIVHQSIDDTEIICVNDSGPGIPEDKIEALFNPFTQLPEHQTKDIKGTGLGLSIVKKIVELHDGKIRVNSTVGEGSTFSFALPKITKGDR